MVAVRLERCARKGLVVRGVRRLSGGPQKEQVTSKATSIPSAGYMANLHSKALRSDVKQLGRVLGTIIAEENKTVFEHVEKMRNLAKDFRRGESKAPFEEMVKSVRDITPGDMKGVARAFSHFLALSNCAETHHRVRELEELRQVKSQAVSAFPPKEDSCRGAIAALLDEENLSPKQVRDTLLKQRVELVLTAHPTEINRRTVLEKHRRIGKLLAAADNLDRLENGKDLGETYERREVQNGFRREVASLFFSDELRRFKPTPVHEAQGGLAIIESVLWEAVPSYLRKLNVELVRQLTSRGLSEDEASLPLDVSPIRFASWIGGDRDGNPNVTPETTLRVAALNRWQAATLFLKDMNELYEELSMSSGFSNQVLEIADGIGPSVDEMELYRKIISHLRERLAVTAKVHGSIFQALEVGSDDDGATASSKVKPLTSVKELMDPLMAIHQSLVQAGCKEIASGRLEDVVRRVAVFGLSIVPLDIRQESGRHLEAIDSITQYLGVGSYAQWTEDTKINWLSQELNSPRPLLPHQAVGDLKSFGFSDTVVDTLETFKVASKLGEGSLGAYVISQAKSASDVLAVALLQQEFGMIEVPSAAGEGGNRLAKDGQAKQMMRVVPLFETLDDLNNAPGIVKRLLRVPAYTGRLGGRLEIMVGYSDSAKDAGRLAAAWAQFRCQEELAKIAKAAGGIELTFFHGKGGTVGRGGSPAVYRAVLSHPPNTIDGRFRVTEQGEMITQNFGHSRIAERTLDVYTAAVLREKHYTHVLPKQEWRSAMDKLAEVSCGRYRNLVREDPNFVQYFRAVTPERKLASLNVGSRPAKRNPKGGVESLRAIPWIFAWSQTRCHLPAWLGVNQGLSQPELEKTLHDMYTSWPWFRELLDLIAMILAKADPIIVENYDSQLIPCSDSQHKEELKTLGGRVREELKLTKSSVLRISGQEDLNMSNPVLKRELEVRSPYLDALNVLQVEVMRRLEQGEYGSEEEKSLLDDCLLITINGISAGLRNSG